MKIVMTLCVRDEEDILETVLQYHLSRGVDRFIVTDNLSQDSTPEILARFERAGRCIVLQETADDYSQWKWVTRMARIAATELEADWLIHCDGDELWWCEEPTFHEALADVPPEVGILEIGRQEFLPRPVSEGSLFERMVYWDTVGVNPVGNPFPPKVVHRAHSEARVAQGNHSVEAPGLVVGEGTEPFTVLHFPQRTFEQFVHKTEVGGRAYANNTELDPAIGDVKRQLYALLESEGLERYWGEQVLDRAELERRIAVGSVARDVRLRDYLRRHHLS